MSNQSNICTEKEIRADAQQVRAIITLIREITPQVHLGEIRAELQQTVTRLQLAIKGY